MLIYIADQCAAPPLWLGPAKTKIKDNAWEVFPKPAPPKGKKALREYERALEMEKNSNGLMGYTKVVVRHGEMLLGVVDKAHIGAASFGLVHSVYEVYGDKMAGELLSGFGLLFTFCAQKWGHTCAIEDLILTDAANEERAGIIRDSEASGVAEAARLVGMSGKGSTLSKDAIAQELAAQIRDGSFLTEEKLDAAMMGITSQSTSGIINVCLPGGQRKPFPENCFSLMVHSGAKGSLVNHSQVSCALGQQSLEGRRVPRMASGRSLPCFSPFDPTPRAGGYISDRFLTGIRPQEYYFHCMAGREGLVDTAVKTANSGYLQRCLVKHLFVKLFFCLCACFSSLLLDTRDGRDVSRNEALLFSCPHTKRNTARVFASAGALRLRMRCAAPHTTIDFFSPQLTFFLTFQGESLRKVR